MSNSVIGPSRLPVHQSFNPSARITFPDNLAVEIKSNLAVEIKSNLAVEIKSNQVIWVGMLLRLLLRPYPGTITRFSRLGLVKCSKDLTEMFRVSDQVEQTGSRVLG